MGEGGRKRKRKRSEEIENRAWDLRRGRSRVGSHLHHWTTAFPNLSIQCHMDSLYQGAQNLVPHTLFFIIFISSTGCAGSLLLHGLSLAAASGGYSLVMVHGLLITVASLAAEDGL